MSPQEFYRTVPKPRYADDPSAWPRGGRPKPANWRQRFGYSRASVFGYSRVAPGHDVAAAYRNWLDGEEKDFYRPGEFVKVNMGETIGVTAAVAPAMVECPSCRCPHECEKCPNPSCDLNLSDEAKAAREARKRADDEWTANFRRFYHGKPMPAETPNAAVEPITVVEAEVIACASVEDAIAEARDRHADAAALLRELAVAYGPRRAHKLNAMADFVLQARRN